MNNGEIGHFLVMVIQTAVFLAPVLIIFYKQGRKDQVLDEVKKDVDGIGKKVAETRECNDEALSDIKHKMDNIDRTLVEVKVTVEHLRETVGEIKDNKRRSVN